MKARKGRAKRQGLPKASVTKLSNKRLNKLAKQGKLKKKGAEKKKLLKLLHRRLHPEKEPHLSTDETGPEKTFLGNDKPAEDIPLEEADYEYFAKEGRDFSFLSNAALESEEKAEGKNKRKRQKNAMEEDEISSKYEKVPRHLPASDKQVKALLPIKTKEKGIIPQTMEFEEEEEKEPTSGGEEEHTTSVPVQEEEEEEDVSHPPPKSVAELFALREQKLLVKKRHIAMLASEVTEDPESNMKKLRELYLMLEEEDPEIFITLKKLTMVSLLEVFKDIIPGYRIRSVTDQEKTQSTKKETKHLREFEASLLTNYKHYLEFLECMAKGKPIRSKDQERKRMKEKSLVEIPPEASKAMVHVSVQCLGELLASHPHFNYRTNIISVLVPFVTHKDPTLSSMVCDQVKKIFKDDRSGDVTLEIVRLLGRLIKARHFHVQPQVLHTFKALKIKEVNKGDKPVENKAARREKFRKLSRKEKKRHKQMGELEKELQEAAAEEDQARKLRVHTEIINMVFLTYFRILKQARNSILLAAVLEGLAKFAHLINVDFFDDLFRNLNELVDSEVLSYRESLHCVQTAFTILSGQGAALNIDPHRFYNHLYRTLFQLHAGESSDDVPIALQCLDLMINRRRKQVSHQRMLAFMKRLATLALQLDTHGALGSLATMRGFIHAYPRSDLLLDTDCQGSGIFLPELGDPEHCNAHNSALYELHSLRRHYHPAVRKYSDHLLIGAPSQGTGALPVDIGRKAPQELYKDFDPGEMTFNPPVDKKPKNSRKVVRNVGEFVQPELTAQTTEVLSTVGGTQISRVRFCHHKAGERTESQRTTNLLNTSNARTKSKLKGHNVPRRTVRRKEHVPKIRSPVTR